MELAEQTNTTLKAMMEEMNLPETKERRLAPRLRLQMVREPGDQSTGPIPVKSPKDVAAQIAVYLNGVPSEHTVVVLMSNQNEIMGILTVAIGNLKQCMVDVGDILTVVLQGRAPAFIFGHNHFGKTDPSKEDLATFRQIKMGSKIVHRELLDCIIVNPNGQYYSWAESAPYEAMKVQDWMKP